MVVPVVLQNEIASSCLTVLLAMTGGGGACALPRNDKGKEIIIIDKTNHDNENNTTNVETLHATSLQT